VYSRIRANSGREKQRIGWLAGTVGGLLLTGLGLELLAHQIFGQTDVATFLLAAYLAAWFSALGIFGFVILTATWLVTRHRQSSRQTADLKTADLNGNIADFHGNECSRPV
jgi:heme/copper-type cytochrome/quinol oxidase subunit 2